MVVSANNLGPTFNNGDAGVFSTVVLIVGTTLACVVVPGGSIVVMVGITLAGVVSPFISMVLIVGIMLVGVINPCGS